MLVCVELLDETERKMAIFDIDTQNKHDALTMALDLVKLENAQEGHEWKFYENEHSDHQNTSNGLWLLIDPEEYNNKNYKSERDALEAAYEHDVLRVHARIVTPGEFWSIDEG